MSTVLQTLATLNLQQLAQLQHLHRRIRNQQALLGSFSRQHSQAWRPPSLNGKKTQKMAWIKERI